MKALVAVGALGLLGTAALTTPGMQATPMAPVAAGLAWPRENTPPRASRSTTRAAVVLSVPSAVVTSTPRHSPGAIDSSRPKLATGPAAPGGIWACIRQHESGGNYATDTGNGYYGAYQFSLPTWRAAGGTGYPDDAAPATQDALAVSWQARAGWGQWSTARGCGA